MRSPSIALVAAGLASLLAAGCEQKEPEISVQVKTVDLVPVAGASVQAEATSAVTDANGEAVLPWKPGTLVTIEAQGYERAERTMPAVKPMQPMLVRLSARPGAGVLSFERIPPTAMVEVTRGDPPETLFARDHPPDSLLIELGSEATGKVTVTVFQACLEENEKIWTLSIDRDRVTSVPNPCTERATVTVDSDPPGAQIWINGQRTDETTPGSLEVRAGEVRVKLTLEGYEDWPGRQDAALGTATLEPGENAVIPSWAATP
jgi:hypothetical protein